MSGLVLKKSPFLDMVTAYVEKALQRTTCDHLIIVAGLLFDQRFKKEMAKASGKKIETIDNYMGVAYEVRSDVPSDRIFVIDKRDWKPKIMVVRA